MDKLCNVDVPVSFCGNSQMDKKIQLVGRPFGGSAIIWKNNIKGNVNEILCQPKRLSCVLYSYNSDISVLILNVYMPFDGSNKYDEYSDILNEVNCLILRADAKFVIFGGDFNTDFSRNNQQTKLLREFVLDEHFYSTSMSDPNCVYYTFTNYDNRTSVIDHIIVNDILKEHIFIIFNLT